MKSTFRILFLARWELKKENDKVPLCARITIDGEKVKFSLKSEVSSCLWDPKSGRAKGQTKEALQLNRYLDSIKGQLIGYYHNLSEANEMVTATMVRDAFLGINVKTNTLLTVFEEFNDRQEKLIGIDLAQSTFNKYDLTYRRLKEFLKVKMRKNDILLCQVDRNFVMDFEAYLKIEYKLDTNSSEKLMRIFKRITTMCFKNGQMPKDPFCDHKLKKVRKDRGYLTKSELESIIDYKPDNKRLEKVRDIFFVLLLHGLRLLDNSGIDGEESRYGRRRLSMDRNTSYQNRNCIEGQTTRYSAVDYPEVRTQTQRRLSTSGDEQRQVQSLPERDGCGLRYREACDFTSCPAYICHDGHLC